MATMRAEQQQESRSDRFEWRPDVGPNAARNLRWFRRSYAVAIAAVAVLGAHAAWGDWSAVALRGVAVPFVLVGCFAALDWVISRNVGFQLVVEDETIRVDRPSDATKEVALPGAAIKLSRSGQRARLGALRRSQQWVLTVSTPTGIVLRQAMPGFGTATRRADYLALERELLLRA